MKADQNDAWQVVHGILAYGRDLKILRDGELVSALDYLLSGGRLRGWNLRPGDHGVKSITEPGSKSGQGHEDQWIGYLSLTGLSPEEPLVVEGQTFKVGDLVRQAQMDIREGMEATWTLMAVSTYLPLDAKWTARDGSEWTIDRIVGMEVQAKLGDDDKAWENRWKYINSSACGATHRLVGLTVALNRHLAEGGDSKSLSGNWLIADRVIQGAIAKAKEFQQPDGSLSTSFFERAGTSFEISDRLYSTGHTLEFLVLATSDAQFNEPWVGKTVVALCDILEATQDVPLECGALYHAARGLQLYRIRKFGPVATTARAEPQPQGS